MGQERDLKVLAQLQDFLCLMVHISGIEDDAAQPGIVAVLEPVNGQGNVPGGKQGHFFARGDHKDLLCIPLPDGKGKPAADHVPQDVVDHVVRPVLVKGPFFFQKIKG